MLALVFFVVCGNATPNPSSVGSEKALERENAAGGIFSITRHPLLWGIALWALAHLIANGDVASLLFFASIVVPLRSVPQMHMSIETGSRLSTSLVVPLAEA
ncbi:MAG: hypothetical protein CMM46_01300 [Rhodospirillaceae bacterium]|nr:hypothetical protein [Rhodospirillaceae bacterium]|tara:strand:+ start:124 stop:429 length:306 start_codon:yes stop_codon:yes gene_type:complete